MNTDASNTSSSSSLRASQIEKLLAAIPATDRSLGAALLQRAPSDSLHRFTPALFTELLTTANTAIKSASKEPVVISPVTIPGAAGWIIALTDRSFIVNTIMECCREAGLRVRALLHPIISQGSTTISLNFLEVDHAPEAALKDLVSSLKDSLLTLIPVTDDYRAGQSELSAIAKELASGSTKLNGTANDASLTPAELGGFVSWLVEGNFSLFGVSTWTVGAQGALTAATTHGMLRGTGAEATAIANEVKSQCERFARGTRPAFAQSLRAVSPVHRRVPLQHVMLSLKRGDTATLISLVGLFTTRGVSADSRAVPVIRTKVAQILSAIGCAEHSHDYKSIINIINSIPREEAFSLPTPTLRNVVESILDVGTSSEAAVTIWTDEERKGVSLTLVALRDRFSQSMRSEVEAFLTEQFGTEPVASQYHFDVTNRPVVRLYFFIPVESALPTAAKLDTVRRGVLTLSRTWSETLEQTLSARGANGHLNELIERYGNAFPEDYQALQTVEDCVSDIYSIEKLSAEHPIAVALENFEAQKPERGTVVMYNTTADMTISRATPALENLGFEVINERSWRITPTERPAVFSNRFRVHTKSGAAIDTKRFNTLAAPILTEVLTDGRDNDPINALSLEAGLDARAIQLLRTYGRFLWQISKFASRFSIIRSISAYPTLAADFWKMFEVLFNPATGASVEARRAQFQQMSAEFLQSLRSVRDITADKVFRSMRMLLEHTLRTNFYLGGRAIALKFRSSAIDIMPQPRPAFEIFVNSPLVEGVHLRAGPVARGGIRWSDRPEDYRSEVLGLMKTQRVKNALIVPTGAKGGFVMKSTPTNPADVGPAVQNAYREYVRAMLSITDNRTPAGVVHPKDVIRYDGEDPYFVVAADKGTATFSDIANRLAVDEFNFWLGDAFASGGSNGYDHKLYAITARGAWECVQRHFRDAEFKFEQTPFTAVGIGDMAGDVFGNGLILSDQYKLVAAFNHKHIFIDPTPDPKSSFAERKRLFELKGSQWSDYSSELISAGGGLYERFDKEIKLSPQARAALGIPADAAEILSGEEVIHHILKAPVDLMWNGGIGTYVKSNTQSHADVADSANDAVRVNADELRIKSVGEGGNLGFTQKARVDFALRGGAVNTDAIDNSGGVDLSDHEVNLKILFAELIRSKKLTVEERNKLLKEMASEVCELVLDHNRGQALLLTLAQRRSVKNMPYIQTLLRDLVKLGYVNRALDTLPEDETLREREQRGIGLTRPELSVCIATTKMWVKDTLLGSELLGHQLMNEFLVEYFPTAIRGRFRNEILAHPLARNIIATQVANHLVDTLGISAMHRLCSRFGAQPSRVLECAVAAELLLNTREMRQQLFQAEPKLPHKIFMATMQSISQALLDATSWFLSRHEVSMELHTMLELYQSSWKELVKSGVETPRFNERLKSLTSHGIPPEMGMVLTLLRDTFSTLEVLAIAHDTRKPLAAVTKVLMCVAETLGTEQLLLGAEGIEPKSRWEEELLAGTTEDIRRGASKLAGQLVGISDTSAEGITKAIAAKLPLDKWLAGVEDMRSKTPELASLSVLARMLN